MQHAMHLFQVPLFHSNY